VHSLGYQAAAHFAADLQCRYTVKPIKNKYFRFKEKKPSLLDLVEN